MESKYSNKNSLTVLNEIKNVETFWPSKPMSQQETYARALFHYYPRYPVIGSNLGAISRGQVGIML